MSTRAIWRVEYVRLRVTGGRRERNSTAVYVLAENFAEAVEAAEDYQGVGWGDLEAVRSVAKVGGVWDPVGGSE